VSSPPSWSRAARTLAFVALGAAGLGVGMLGTSALADRTDDPYAPLDRFAKVFSDIERNYVEEISGDRLVDAAIRGMTDELDPHSVWLDAEGFHALQEETEGRYQGIGIEVRVIDGELHVLRVLRGGPAERDGVQVGDRIISVNGDDVRGLELREVSARITGARGTEVRITVLRQGADDPVEIRTIRDRIDIAPVHSATLPGGVAYVRLVGFQEGAATEVQRAIRKGLRDGADQGVILDLRDNPGGLLDEAVRLADLFVDEGPIVTTRGRTEGEQVMPASRGGFSADLPVVVLVNGNSASASEVVVGALQDLGRATIVGTRTYGKGSVQTLFHRDGGGLKLTTARYFTPAGTPVALHQGRVPDLVVPYPTLHGPKARLRTRISALDGIDDSERQELLDLVQHLPDDEGYEPIIPWDDPMHDRLRDDPQLRAALAHLGVELPSR